MGMGNRDLKVLLVQPPLHRLYPTESKDSKRHKFEPLALEMIAAHNPYNLPLKIFDLDIYPNQKKFERFLEQEQPDVIGIAVNTPLVLEAKQIAKTARKVLGTPFVVVGGNHPTYEPSHSLEYIKPDLVWRGEGESFLRNLVELDFSARVRTGISNIFDHRREDMTFKESKASRFEMDNLNFPVRHNPEDYFFNSMQTSRGCLWSCIYCNGAEKRVVWRNPENILEELDSLQEKGLFGKKIYFLDDCFLDNLKRVRALAEGIKERGYAPAPQFWIETRADSITHEIVEMIKEAGCYQMTFGIESGNQRVINSLNKRISLDRVRNALDVARQHGIRIRANFMMGHYGETEEEVWDTIHFAEELVKKGPEAIISFFKVLPLPGTPLYRKIINKGISLERGFEDFAWYGDTVSRMSKIDPKRLDELHQIAYTRIGAASNKGRKTDDY